MYLSTWIRYLAVGPSSALALRDSRIIPIIKWSLGTTPADMATLSNRLQCIKSSPRWNLGTRYVHLEPELKYLHLEKYSRELAIGTRGTCLHSVTFSTPATRRPQPPHFLLISFYFRPSTPISSSTLESHTPFLRSGYCIDHIPQGHIWRTVAASDAMPTQCLAISVCLFCGLRGEFDMGDFFVFAANGMSGYLVQPRLVQCEWDDGWWRILRQDIEIRAYRPITSRD
ncbi:hypothetical protein F4801DRAFT_378464 [Xylaria longipes]|nr:hypothetical protein F4801DRAFT_378464 [Xylaria longipes]